MSGGGVDSEHRPCNAKSGSVGVDNEPEGMLTRSRKKERLSFSFVKQLRCPHGPLLAEAEQPAARHTRKYRQAVVGANRRLERRLRGARQEAIAAKRLQRAELLQAGEDRAGGRVGERVRAPLAAQLLR